MNTVLDDTLKAKAAARKDWQKAPIEVKLRALIQLQRLARNMAQAANRPFTGVVWHDLPRYGETNK